MMNKLLRAVVLFVFSLFPCLSHADPELLIDRLKNNSEPPPTEQSESLKAENKRLQLQLKKVEQQLSEESRLHEAQVSMLSSHIAALQKKAIAGTSVGTVADKSKSEQPLVKQTERDKELSQLLVKLADSDQRSGGKNSRESERNKQQSEQFVARAAQVKGAVKAASGVIYQVVKKGTAPEVTQNDVIRFRFDEKLSSGKVLSAGEIRRKRAAELPAVIGLGVPGLGVGGQVKITVPWQLAYGEQGISGIIPPGVASEITLEILSLNK
ncbi:FKBP-type peptidyl-prolyl cis-trans isomerase [Phytobacter sp. V91]|uniref:FKBP-type peptidyl-prolyl cis-trans isomerase n=1 Tax=Phytobacter sp. V91 TaxID=3369425 RepID=UPI003F5EA696